MGCGDVHPRGHMVSCEWLPCAARDAAPRDVPYSARCKLPGNPANRGAGNGSTLELSPLTENRPIRFADILGVLEETSDTKTSLFPVWLLFVCELCRYNSGLGG